MAKWPASGSGVSMLRKVRAQGVFRRFFAGSMLGILYTFGGIGFHSLCYCKKDPFFLPRVMWAKFALW